MQIVAIRSSGKIEDQTWDEQSFHMWRLGRADGLIRTATALDLGVEIWSVSDDERGAVNQLGAEIAERLRDPGQSIFRTPYTGDMVITGRERTGLAPGQVELLMGQAEAILAPIPEPEPAAAH